MFKKVLIVEDLDSITKAVTDVLEDLEITEINHALYCDEALLKVKRAAQDGAPFDLVICDLSFKSDHRIQKLNSGEELVAVLRPEFPDLKIIVNSIEDHPQTVRNLFNNSKINAYVCKDRQGMRYLEAAIQAVAAGKNYISPQVEEVMKQEKPARLSEHEMLLLNHLANGLTQEDIMRKFEEEGRKPRSRSSIEKHLRELREEFNAQTTAHLISILKDLRLL